MDQVAGINDVNAAQQPCAFCAKVVPLRVSHVLPAFIYRWLRNRSGGSGHIRHTDTPNQRVQDGLKLSWLCGDCEALFSRYETAFATKLFHPWHAGQRDIEYGDWLLKFCASVSWRVLRYARGQNKATTYTAEQMQLLDCAEMRWRAFLNGEVPHPGEFEQHLVFFDRIESTNVDGLPSNINRFMTGAVTLDIVGSSKSLMTFAKLGGFIVFGSIQHGRDPFAGTKVHVNHGRFNPRRIVLPAGLLDLFKEKAAHAAAAMDTMSASQRDKVDANVLANLDRFAESEQLKAIMADAEMFGEQAILRKK